MSEILVLVDHVDGAVRKTTNELLTIARRLGEPSAVFIGSPSDDAVAALKSFGAEKIYVVDDAEIKGYLVAPKAEVLQQLAEKTSATAILIRRPKRRCGPESVISRPGAPSASTRCRRCARTDVTTA